ELVALLESLPMLPELSALSIDANGAVEVTQAPDLTRLSGLTALETLELGAQRKLVRLDGIEHTRVSRFVLRDAAASLEPLRGLARSRSALTLAAYGGAVPANTDAWRWLAASRAADLGALAALTELTSLELLGFAIAELSFL